MTARTRLVGGVFSLLLLGLLTPSVRAEHYAVIFAGGINQAKNHQRYYDSVSRIHDAFLRDLNVLGTNIFVMAADGTDPADDIDGGGSSDWSFITSTGGTIEAGTHDNMQNRLAALAAILKPEDTLIVWTYDHGGGTEGDPSVLNEESLSCWEMPGQSGSIRDDELAAWLAPIQAKRQAYFLGQCFSGGMLDDLVNTGIVYDDGAGGDARFGCAATTHYEVSSWFYDENPHHYIDGVQDAIRNHSRTTTFAIEQWAYDHTPNAIGRGPGGTWEEGKQHPWRAGEDFELAVAHWYGTGSGNWTDASEWKAGVLPQVAGRPVRIAGPHPCNVVGGTYTTDLPLMMTMDGGMLDIESGAVMEVHEMVNDGRLRVLDGNFEVTTLLHGSETGEIEVFNDGRFHTSWGRDYAGNVLVAGGTFEIFADYTGGGGDLTVHSSGTFSVGQDMLLGGDTHLDINQTGSTTTITRHMTLSGSVTVRNGGHLTVGNNCTLGDEGPTDVTVDYGVMEVDDGLDLQAGSIQLHGDPETAQLIAYSLDVGERGNVNVTFNGGRIQAHSMRFGTEAGYSCNITMDESGWLAPQIVTAASGGQIEFGPSGDAHVVQNAGVMGNFETAASHPTITLAGGTWSTSTYELNDGAVYAENLIIGNQGDGTFTQNGGTVEVFGDLRLGTGIDSSGVYNLRGGNLIAHGFDLGSPGTGTLNIDGGTLMLPGATVNIQNLNIGSVIGHAGEFYLGPRTLNGENLNVGVRAGGVLTAQFSHIFVSDEIHVGYNHMNARVDQQGGEVHAPEITIGTLDDGWGEWNMNGGTMNTTMLTVGHSGWGQFNQYGDAVVEVDNLDIGFASDTGNNIYTLDDGTLTVAGTMRLGVLSGSTGRFRLRGSGVADLVTATQVDLGAGLGSEGRFEHSGGRHHVTGELHVGNGGDGRYELSGGSLLSETTAVGQYGNGVFEQSGGTHETTTLHVGRFGEGQYDLGGTGQLACRTLFVGHYNQGTLNQTGGNLNVTGDAFVGHSSEALSSVAQTAGTSAIDGNLYVGFGPDGPGTYTLGGDPAVGIRQDVVGNIYLGYDTGSDGTYTLAGRGIYTPELHVGGDVFVGHNGSGTLAMAGGRLTGEHLSMVRVEAGSVLQGDGMLAVPVVNLGTVLADGAYPLTFQESLHSFGEVQIEGPSEFVRGRVELWSDATLDGHVTNNGYFQTFGDGTVNLNGGMSGNGEVTTGSGGTFIVNSALATGRLDMHGPFYAGSDVTADTMNVQATAYHVGGHTQVGRLAISMGRYELSGATAELTSDLGGESIAGDFIQSAGMHTATTIQVGGMAWYMGQPGRYEISGGRVEVGTLRLGAEIGEVMDPMSYMPNMEPIAGTLAITDTAAEVYVTEQLLIASLGAVEAIEGAVIHMTGSAFENNATDPTACAGLSSVMLLFEGGEGVVDDFEIAGFDYGADPAGLVDNFALGTLCLGGDRVGHIRLVDLCDNLLDGADNEVLYVENLLLGAGSSLDLNGHKLYYLHGTFDPDCAVLFNGGTLTAVPEPSTLVLAALGTIGLLIISRRKNQKVFSH
ncbi:MAG: PEP-CTERM sorting domain-containing protein [Pirellulales bacterium]|nr:PEP-CTERM sorting domain-containing protein [Pirellulales bacterium]